MTRTARGGFSLLEMMLAMTILLGSIAVLGELASLGRRNAAQAAALTRAELLCESLMAEIAASGTLPETVEEQPIPEQQGWLYSVRREPLEQPGIVSVRISVAQDLPKERRPVRFALVRWLPEPASRSGSTPNGSSSGSSVAPAGGTQ
ncbi:MAG: prepilin-type N-terminal cleavage/methylation domain-containing protein [Pirellulales bacterium]|nr:prepilin-type N-terminal cleavage/methylation domain-containing protein [Pirellulales bacterium]